MYSAAPEEWDCRIPLSNIHKSGEPRQERFELPLDGAVEYWGQAYDAAGGLDVLVTANWAGGDIIVRVKLSGKFSLPCSRCLEETGIAIDGDMRYLFTRRVQGGAGKKRRAGDGRGNEEDDADATEIDQFAAELDLRQYVWETMILSLPERVLCGDDCLGLCPVCGGNRNLNGCGCPADDTDPRLEILRDLQ
jgi:uncharacterized protein